MFNISDQKRQVHCQCFYLEFMGSINVDEIQSLQVSSRHFIPREPQNAQTWACILSLFPDTEGTPKHFVVQNKSIKRYFLKTMYFGGPTGPLHRGYNITAKAQISVVFIKTHYRLSEFFFFSGAIVLKIQYKSQPHLLYCSPNEREPFNPEAIGIYIELYLWPINSFWTVKLFLYLLHQLRHYYKVSLMTMVHKSCL